jgi:hypothetical protein
MIVIKKKNQLALSKKNCINYVGRENGKGDIFSRFRITPY